MLLYAAVLTLVGIVAHRFWILSGFLQDGAKSGRIFLLTTVTGLCLVTNLVFPFLLAGIVISALELRSLILHT